MTSISEDAAEKIRKRVEAVYRAESRRVFATLIRRLGDFDLAEEALHDAFRAALEQWPQNGEPANPRAWLISVGRFKAIDRLRRQSRLDALEGNGNLKAIKVADIKWEIGYTGKPEMIEIEGSEREIPCELALLAIGFVHGDTAKIREKIHIELDQRGNVSANNYQTNVEKVFAAGDMRRGQSLVVWAISEGREAARAVDEYLMGESVLESKDGSKLEIK